MIDLKPLFAYQEAEKKMASAEAALRNTPARTRLNQLYRLLKNQQQLVTKLNDELHEREQQFQRMKEQVAKLNEMIKEYAKAKHYKVVDYATVLADANGETRSDLSGDSVHPNLAGYKLMEEALMKVIR